MRPHIEPLGTCLIGLILVASCSPMATVTQIPESISLPTSSAVSYPPGTIVDEASGIVRDSRGPVEGAVVRVQTTERAVTTDQDGAFAISLADLGSDPVKLTGWAPGYFIAGPVLALPGESDLVIELQAHADHDNADYNWLPSRYYPGMGEGQGCAECHSRQGTDLAFSLPVDEWLLDAHAQSAVNERFISMYNGSDLSGNASPLTRKGYSRDYGSFPLRPDLSSPYYGPGYKLDFPDTDGNCGSCHTPAAAANAPYGTNPNGLSGVAAEGVPCDFCHKVWDVRLNAEDGLPQANMPGVLSFEFRRPDDAHQFFAGPLDDVAPGEDTYSPLQRESAFCAPCHFGVFWDTVVYNSYGEWLASPYSDADTGRTCQDCHMPPLGATQFATTDAGGLARQPEQIFSHRMPGAADQELLRNALDWTASAEVVGEVLVVTVSLVNDNTGHNLPTDFPGRQMLLVVQAVDNLGGPLELLEGEVLPEWAGVGEADQGNYAGLPGKGYALVLMELWTEVAPSVAYWNPTRVVSDTRLKPLESDTTRYHFTLPASRSAEVRVSLLFRRAYKELMDQKGWDFPDITMGTTELKIQGQ